MFEEEKSIDPHCAGSLEVKMKNLIDEFGLEACHACLTRHINSGLNSESHNRLNESINSRALDRPVKINQAIVEASFHPLVVINDHGIIQKVNQSLLSKFEYDREDELIPQNMSILCGKEHRIQLKLSIYSMISSLVLVKYLTSMG